MQGAFVVRLGPGTNPSTGVLEGWVEEVDSGREIRFHSSQELLKFLIDLSHQSSVSSQHMQNTADAHAEKED